MKKRLVVASSVLLSLTALVTAAPNRDTPFTYVTQPSTSMSQEKPATTLDVKPSEDPFEPRAPYAHASSSDLSAAALKISRGITTCANDSACIAATLMLNKETPLDAVAAFSHATSQDSPAANQCHAPSHQLGRVLSVQDVASSPFLAVCSDGLLHGLFESWGALRTLSQVIEQFPSLCGSLAANSCAHVAGHALSKASDASVPLALKACADLGIDAMGCSSGIVMLVFDALRSSPSKPSLKTIDSVCDDFTMPARRDCEGELPWQWELSGLSWPGVITKCENVSKEGRRSCARGAGRLAYQGSLVSPEVAVSRCKMAASQDLVESCLGSAASEVGKNAGALNPGLICDASRSLRDRCLALVNDYS